MTIIKSTDFKLDKHSEEIFSDIQEKVNYLQQLVLNELSSSAYQGVTLERLEEFYFWAGKAICLVQLQRESKTS